MVTGLELCLIWKPRSLKPSELKRATITKGAGETGEGSQKLMGADEAVAEEGEAVYGVFGSEAEAVGTPMVRSSM